MKTFLRINMASLSASGVDYLVTILLVRFFQVDPVAGGVVGTVAGGVVNFFIGRYWVHKSHHTALALQGQRYLLSWVVNLALNAAGLHLLIKVYKVQYVLAKTMTSIFVAVAFNYPVQKKWVFKNN